MFSLFRSILACLLLTMFSFRATAQNSFQKIYNDGLTNTITSIIRVDSSSYIVSGAYESLASSHLPGYSWLAKVNNAGEVLWRKKYPTVTHSRINLVIQGNGGGYFAVGHIIDELGFYQTFVLKTDDDGNQQWSKIFLNYFDCIALRALPDGYMLGGNQNQTGLFSALVKIDNAGNLGWRKLYGVNLHDIAVVADTVYVAGDYNSQRAFFAVAADEGDIYSAKVFRDTMASTGNVLSQLRLTADGNFIASGWAPSPDLMNRAVTLQKFSKDGTILFSKRLFRDNESLFLGSLGNTNDGGFFLAGHLPDINNAQGTLVKVSATADLEAAAQYTVGGGYDDYYRQQTVQAPDGGFMSIYGALDKLVLTKTQPDLLVTDCCTRPFPVNIDDLPVLVENFPLIMSNYGQIASVFPLSAESIPYAGTDYCPAVPLQLAKTLFLCGGDSVQIGGQWYSQPGIVADTILSTTACDTISTYTLQLSSQPVKNQHIEFCAGESVIIGGVTYTQSDTVVSTLPAATGCDTLVTYILQVVPQPVRTQHIEFCEGESVIINGVTYTQSDTVVSTLPATVGCDTLNTYILQALPQPVRTEHIEFCTGESVVIGSVTYTQSDTVLFTLPAAVGCDTLVTYILQTLPQPVKNQHIEFCPGDSVVINGVTYTQPDTIVSTLPAAVGCDTLITYALAFTDLSASVLSLQCPANITVSAAPGSQSAAVSYTAATADSDCPCGTVDLVQTQGLPSGSSFPLGANQICYAATDACGSSTTCCFTVQVEAVTEENACDIKTTSCVKFELLKISQNPAGQKTYRLRVTNTCLNQLLYTAFQLPNGVVADAPGDNGTYTTAAGRNYTVRNGNESPFYSIRFKSNGAGIANGQSDIFEYMLPPQAAPLYILAGARLDGQTWYEAHLNVFNCPVQAVANKLEDEADARSGFTTLTDAAWNVFPNPFNDQLTVAFALEAAAGAELILTDLTGRVLFSEKEKPYQAGQQSIRWQTAGLSAGVYSLGLKVAGSGWQYRKVVLLR